jgi:teichuronic acid exporter
VSVPAEPSEIGLVGALVLAAESESLNLRRGAVRGGVAVVGSRLATQVFTVAVTLLVARILNPYDYGVVTTATLFLGLADSLAMAGLGSAMVHKLDLSEAAQAEAFTLSLMLAFLLGTLQFLAAGFLAGFFACPDLAPVLRVSTFVLLLSPFRTVPSSILERRMQLGRQSAVSVIATLFQGVIVLGAALAGLGYWSLVAGFTVGRLIEAVGLARLAGWTPRLRALGPTGRELLRFGIPLTGSALMWQIYSQADYAVAAKIAGPVVLGYYSMAFQVVSLPTNKLASAFGQVAYVVFCRLQDQRERVRDWYLRLVSLLGVFGLPVFAGMALVAGDATLTVLGPKWLPMVSPWRLLCLPGYVLFLNCTLHPVLYAFGRPDLPAKYNAANVLVMPAMFFVMGSRYGITGICVAWAVFFPLISGILVMLSRPVLGFGLRELARTQAPAWGATAVMATAVLAVQRFVPHDGRASLRLALSVATGVAVYTAAILALARHTVLRDLRALRREMGGQRHDR